MGDVEVDTFLETLKQLIPKVKSSKRRRHQLRSLAEDISYMGEFLKVAEKKCDEHSEVRRMVRRIKDLVFEAESIVEIYVARANRTNLNANQDNPSLCVGSVKEKIKTLTAEIGQIYNENMYDINGLAGQKVKHSVSKTEGGSSSSGESNTSELGVVGLKKEVNTLLTKLHDYGDGGRLEIINIIGAAGGGKTTLVREVYEHHLTREKFVRAWVTVSQDYDSTMKRNLLMPILESASSAKSGDYENSNEDKLGEDVYRCLYGKKYLIVMDDMWGVEAWNDIQRSFPKERNGSKVLFTSRMPVEPNDISYVPHRLDPLAKSYSWMLFKKKVFGKNYCPPKLVGIGKDIVEKCEGLPLAIVTVAGILAVEDKTPESWKEVEKNLSSTIAQNQDGCMKILELSYNHLPLHLRVCFLYIGGFPEDFEIPVRELIWLWIAEGFIQPSEEDKSLEDVAKGYLSNLFDRNLIMEVTKRPYGETKTCRIHDLLRELCLEKAKEDKFLVKVYKDDTFPPYPPYMLRRLFYDKRRSFGHFLKDCTQNLRSFLCFVSPKSNEFSYGPDLSILDENFELLRVLSLTTCVTDGRVKRGIGRGHLVYLRYLAMVVGGLEKHDSEPDSGYFELPFSHLSNLETLSLRFAFSTDEPAIRLHRGILKMVKLRHLYAKNGVFVYHPRYLNGSFSYYPNSSSNLDSLQTLYHICPCTDCREFLERTPNLKKLGIYDIRGLNDENADLEFLTCLETLTICNWKMFSNGIPLELKFPPTLTQLTLKYTDLSWERLSSLQTLPRLEVLKLLDDACSGPFWDTRDQEGFSQLKYLRLQGLKIERWNATEEQFPRLEVLVVDDCEELKKIPTEFANLNDLQKIEVKWSSYSVYKSAKKIQKERINNRGDDGRINLLANDYDAVFDAVPDDKKATTISPTGGEKAAKVGKLCTVICLSVVLCVGMFLFSIGTTPNIRYPSTPYTQIWI